MVLTSSAGTLQSLDLTALRFYTKSPGLNSLRFLKSSTLSICYAK